MVGGHLSTVCRVHLIRDHVVLLIIIRGGDDIDIDDSNGLLHPLLLDGDDDDDTANIVVGMVDVIDPLMYHRDKVRGYSTSLSPSPL